jgi:hypothetical protein
MERFVVFSTRQSKILSQIRRLKRADRTETSLTCIDLDPGNGCFIQNPTGAIWIEGRFFSIASERSFAECGRALQNQSHRSKDGVLNSTFTD